MWICSKCREESPEEFDTCWKCQAARPAAPWAEPPPLRVEAAKRQMRVAYRIFRGTLSSWDTLFREASEFAAKIGPDHLISISHSADHHDGVVTVWYWER